MSGLILALISLGISAALVLSSFLWWTTFSGGPPASVDTEGRGFPVHYYSVITTYQANRTASSLPISTLVDSDLQTFTVDILVIFILCLVILTLWRWRALSNSGRRDRRRIST